MPASSGPIRATVVPAIHDRWADPARTGLVPRAGADRPTPIDPGRIRGKYLHADVPTGIDLEVHVSTDPETRLMQSASFFRRNPGYAATGMVSEDLVEAAIKLPGIGDVVRAARPTQLGYGQPTYDQMRWQVDSGRQPDSRWWMAMNARLVGDALTAEALVREGHADEARLPRHKAWVKYIEASDEIRRTLKVPVGAGYTTPGAIVDFSREQEGNAISDAWKGVSLLTRMKVRFLLLPRARLAFWKAHETSIRTARNDLVPLMREVSRSSPREAEFGSAWARAIELPKHINLTATGHIDASVMSKFLPQSQLDRGAKLTGPQRFLTRLLQAFDPTWERDMERPRTREAKPRSAKH